MNPISLLATFAMACALLQSSCVSNEPESYESALIRQDKKLKKRLEKSQQKSESWGQRWDDYKRRQDQKYDSWIDKVMD